MDAYKMLGTILGALILIAGLAMATNSLINPMFGYIPDLFMGLTAILIGFIIIYAARRIG